MKSISYLVFGLLLFCGLSVEAQESPEDSEITIEAQESLDDGYGAYIEAIDNSVETQGVPTENQIDPVLDAFVVDFLDNAQQSGRPNVIDEKITSPLNDDNEIGVSFVVENNSDFPTEEIFYSVYPGFRISGGGTMTHPLFDGVVRSEGFILLPGERREILSEVIFPEKFSEYQKAAVEIRVENTQGINLSSRTLLIPANNGNSSTLETLDYLAPATLEMFINNDPVGLQYGPTIFITEDTYRVKATLPDQKGEFKLIPKFEYFRDSYLTKPLRTIKLNPIITSESESVEFFIDVNLNSLRPGIYPVKLSFESDKEGVIINHTVGRFIIGGERGKIVYINPIINEGGLLNGIDLLLHGAAPDIINDARERSRPAKVNIKVTDYKDNILYEYYRDIQLLPITKLKILPDSSVDASKIYKILVTLSGKDENVLDTLEYVFDREEGSGLPWLKFVGILSMLMLALVVIFNIKKKHPNKILVFMALLMTATLHADVYAAPVNSDLEVNFYAHGGPTHDPTYEQLYNLTTAGYVNLTVNEPTSECYPPGSIIPIDVEVSYQLCGNIPIDDCDGDDPEACEGQDYLQFTVYGFEDWFFPVPKRAHWTPQVDEDLTDAWWRNLYENTPREHNPTSSINVLDTQINTAGGVGSHKAEVHAPALPGTYKLYMKLEGSHKKGWSRWSGSVDVNICGQTDACLYMPGVQTVDSNGVLRDEDNSVLEGYEVKFLSTSSDNRDYSGSNVTYPSQYVDGGGFRTDADPYKLRTICNYCGTVPFVDNKENTAYFDKDYEAEVAAYPTKAVYDNTWINRYIGDIGGPDWVDWYANNPNINDSGTGSDYWRDRYGLEVIEDYLKYGYLDNVYGAGEAGYRNDFNFGIVGGYDSEIQYNYYLPNFPSRGYGAPDLTGFRFDDVYLSKSLPFKDFSVGGVVFHRKSAGSEPGKDIFTATFPRYIEEAEKSNGDLIYISGLAIPYYGNNRTSFTNINQPVTPPPPLVLTGTMPELLKQILTMPDRYDDINHSGSAYVDQWARNKVFPTPPADYGLPSLDLSSTDNLYFFKEDYIESGSSGVGYGDNSQCILYEDYCPGPENPGVQFTVVDSTYSYPQNEPWVILFQRDVTGAGDHTVIRKLSRSLASPENLCQEVIEPKVCPNMPGFTYVLDEVFDDSDQVVVGAAYSLELDLCILVCPYQEYDSGNKYNPVDNKVYRFSSYQGEWQNQPDLNYDVELNQCISDVCVDIAGIQFANSGSYPATAVDHPTESLANADGSNDTYFIGPSSGSCYLPICTNAVELGLTGNNSLVWWDNPYPTPGPAYDNPDYPSDYFPLDPYYDGCDAIADGNCDYNEYDLWYEIEYSGYNPVYWPACDPFIDGNCDYAGAEPDDGVVYASTFKNAPYELNPDGSCTPPPTDDLCSNIAGDQLEDDFLSGGTMYGVVQNSDGTCNACANFANNVGTVPAGYESSIVGDVQYCDFCSGTGNLPGIQQEYSLGIRTHETPVNPHSYDNAHYTQDVGYVKQSDGMCELDVCSNLDEPIQPDPGLVPSGYFALADGTCEPDACPNSAELGFSLYDNGGLFLLNGNNQVTEYYIDGDGMCVMDVDMCDNIPGDQLTVPQGYVGVEDSCDYCHGGDRVNVPGLQVNGASAGSLLNGRVYTTTGGTNVITDLDPATCSEFICENLHGSIAPEAFSLTGLTVYINNVETDLDYDSGDNTCGCDSSDPSDPAPGGCQYSCVLDTGYRWLPDGSEGSSCEIACVVTDGSASNFPLSPTENGFAAGATVVNNEISYTLGGAAYSSSRTCTPGDSPPSVIFETTDGFIDVGGTCDITLETTGVGFCELTLNNEGNTAQFASGICESGTGLPGNPCLFDATDTGGILGNLGLQLNMTKPQGSVLVSAVCGVIDTTTFLPEIFWTGEDECRLTPNIGEF